MVRFHWSVRAGWTLGSQTRTNEPAKGSVGTPTGAKPASEFVAGSVTPLYCTSVSAAVKGGLMGTRSFVPVPSRYDAILNAPSTTVLPLSALGVQANPIRGWTAFPPYTPLSRPRAQSLHVVRALPR